MQSSKLLEQCVYRLRKNNALCKVVRKQPKRWGETTLWKKSTPFESGGTGLRENATASEECRFSPRKLV
uniref:Uncharacterized protein n=1 Tax=Siphoviridae sp. ctjOC2 TaxID=2825632 RepID=A0A8S5Q7U5_9CAUD|nr:MAG TPA: hypothetical protein [Siphoviridae sp. ctjOC2]